MLRLPPWRLKMRKREGRRVLSREEHNALWEAGRSAGLVADFDPHLRCDHTPAPKGYLQWHEWAEKMAKTHRQVKCACCGLWANWVPKKSAREAEDAR